MLDFVQLQEGKPIAAWFQTKTGHLAAIKSTEHEET